MPIIDHYIESKQRKAFSNESLRDSMNFDFSFINQRIWMSNILKIIRTVLQVLFISFFIGQYWYIFSETMHEYLVGETHK